MFVTFEGPDGAGKSTVLKMIIKFLDEQNIRYFLTKEPGAENNIVARKIRKILLDTENEMSDMTEALLYTADRRLNLETNIWPNLEKGILVLGDRYFDSTFAYQGAGRGLGIEDMVQLQEVATKKTYPDLTFFFDLPPEKAEKRLANRDKLKKHDRLELAGKEFHRKVYEGYKEVIAKDTRNRFRIIDSSKSIDEVFAQVKKVFIKEILNKN